MFQKKIRPIHVVSVTPAARASTSHFERVLQGAVILNHDDCPSNNPHLLVSEDRGVACRCRKPKEEGLELGACVLREDSNTYPLLSRQRRLMLNCSSKGTFISIPGTGDHRIMELDEL